MRKIFAGGILSGWLGWLVYLIWTREAFREALLTLGGILVFSFSVIWAVKQIVGGE